MHNYIINDRVLFNTFSGELSRLDDPKQLIILDNNAKRLFLRLIDSGYQIVPCEYLLSDIKDSHNPANTARLITAELDHIVEAFRHINEFEPVLVAYSNGVQLSTDVELKVVTSYRTFDNNSEDKPHIAKESLFNPALREHKDNAPQEHHEVNHFVWYYTRIALAVSLFIFALYFALNLFSTKPNYFADYHPQGKYGACNVFIHNQKPTDLAHLKMRLEEFAISCNAPKNIYLGLPADDKRESIQVCTSDPDNDKTPCTNFYVVKVK